jgi:3-methylfumaryl-CoA hydratase
MNVTAVNIDIDELRMAIGQETLACETITQQQCLAFCATLDKPGTDWRQGAEAPLAIHWCLAPPAVRMSDIGTDGHPRRGGFLPAVPLPRRMWAGGRLTFHDSLRVGDTVERLSRIADVTLKRGKAGPLCFVKLHHSVSTKRGLAIEEWQDIVYRTPEPLAASVSKIPEALPVADAGRQAEISRCVFADSVLLFRYSALTFNAHRIHYDLDYAIQEENYPGLVVHGPLQATLLLDLAKNLRGAPKGFGFRGVSPLIANGEFTVNAASTDTGMDLWIADGDGRQTMTASAQW